MSSQIAQTVSEAQVTLELACQRLLSLQDQAGWWRGELQTNVTMDAEDMLLREFLGIRRAEEAERSAAWIRSQQRTDGTWANFYGAPGDLSTTIEAYWALRLAGDQADAEHMRAAADFIRAQGGIEHARVFTHVWLALFGLWSWDQVPALPPEIVLLPSWVALNIYDFACWARQTIVALSLVMAHRPRHELPFALEELRGPEPWRAAEPTSVRGRWLTRLDRVLRVYERRPPRLLRRIAMARAERWIVRRQEADGSWGGIQPPWVYSLMALRLNGYALEHPLMRRGIEGLDRFMVEERGEGESGGLLPVSESVAPPGSRRLEACQSPVWDTALSVVALSDAGLPGEHPALVRAGEWLLGQEICVPGDWRVRRPTLEPGGWAFEFANDNYPDVDDTAEVVLALLRLHDASRVRGGHPFSQSNSSAETLSSQPFADERAFSPVNGAGPMHEPAPLPGWQRDRRLRAAIDRAVNWTKGMQSREGAWGAFDADNTRSLVRELPFLDFGETIDEPSADVTAHAVEMLAALGRAGDPETVAAVRWLIERQEPGGSWFGRWGVNHVYGTGAVLPALVAAGVAASEPCIARAVAWLERHQKSDGGWGEDPRSYDHAEWVGRGESTASQTAWALLALHAAGERSDAVARGVQWLVDTQLEDGGWDEPQYTGTGFPCDYYINYHLYRLVFPVMALGRCLSGGRR
ncbi:MAG TPA: prenyltransferase/squalene oxidase repeat-containing protein [Solirubrobacteraceae bacterium]|jgi:squalene-hopene/tetraprenyl-beta-curcumene cyclase|nr:prenyltransferase/squalene oxidase repeat-containing protein [Solirubrobacteraceae bacterium]